MKSGARITNAELKNLTKTTKLANEEVTALKDSVKSYNEAAETYLKNDRFAAEKTFQHYLGNGDDYNLVVKGLSSPQRGDMIVFRTSASDDAALHIRRVIGLPGETVQISGGRILINGEVYNEGKDFPMITNPGLAATAVTLESGEYFVLGDNRNNSEDSRYADIGMVRKRYIVGKIWFTCSPFEKLGFTKG